MREEFEFFYMFILKRIKNMNLNKNSNYINLNVSWELIVFFSCSSYKSFSLTEMSLKDIL